MRDVFLVKSGGAAAMPDWQALFAPLLPHLDIRWWDDPSVDPQAVAYALVWQPEPGRLAGYPNLRAIFSSGAGVDHIVNDPTCPQHVPVIRMTAEQTTQTVAEYVCLHALAWLRDFDRMRRAQAEKRWDLFEGPRLAPQTRVGIMGLGSIGQLCAGMLKALGFQAHGWARSPKSIPGVACYAGQEALPDFLRRTDLLVGLVPDTPQTRGLINAETIALLPKGAAVMNVARGPLVVLDDLIAALDSGHLSAAILDVFETEPLPASHPAWAHPKITVTAHVAGFTSRPARAEKIAGNIRLLDAGRPPEGLYDRTRGY